MAARTAMGNPDDVWRNPSGQWPPPRKELPRFAVSRPGWEVVRWSFYDRVTFIATVNQPLSVVMFQDQRTIGLTGTNVPAVGGMLPEGQEFLIEDVEIAYQISSTRVPAAFNNTSLVTDVLDTINGHYILTRSGNVALWLGQKQYVSDAPIGRFPPRYWFTIGGAFADATTPGPVRRAVAGIPNNVGDLYSLLPLLWRAKTPMRLEISFPEGALGLDIGGLFRAYIRGLLYRKVQ